MSSDHGSLLSHPGVIALLVVSFVFIWYTQAGVVAPVPHGLPWIGKKEEFLAGPRAAIRSFNGMRAWLNQGYLQYSKKGKSYNIPDVSGRSETIIPREKLSWLLNHPDDVASVRAAHDDLLYGKYNFTDPIILGNVFHEHVVHKSMARNVAALIPNIQDEVETAIDEAFGKEPGKSKEIAVVTTMMALVGRASNRMFVGKPLCRNPDYLAYSSGFANAVIAGISLIPLVPDFLRPIIAPLITLPNRYYWYKCSRFTIPLIKDRKANLLRAAQDPTFDYDAPNDYITWHLNVATAEQRTRELDPVMVSRYLMPINFAAIHTTTFSISNLWFDLLGSDPSKKFLEGITEEVVRVFRETNGSWSKAALGKLYRTDSAIRESMRISNFATRGLTRKILSPAGITEPDEGFTVPCGGSVSIDVNSIHHDPDIYPNPNEFDAFRFSRPIEEAERKIASGEALADKDMLKLKQMSVVSTSDTFLPWGHKMHACPGRFFASHEMKMIVAHVVLNYELEYMERPTNFWFGSNVIPDSKVMMKVRRKA